MLAANPFGGDAGGPNEINGVVPMFESYFGPADDTEK